MKILIINGANLNLLGAREEEHYGKLTLQKLESVIQSEFPEHTFTFFQSNIEGEIIERLQNYDKFDGIIINPGGYAHTSVAIRDALELVKIIKIEVHLSNLSSRENFRQSLLTASVTDGYISGFKENSYLAAVYLLNKLVGR